MRQNMYNFCCSERLYSEILYLCRELMLTRQDMLIRALEEYYEVFACNRIGLKPSRYRRLIKHGYARPVIVSFKYDEHTDDLIKKIKEETCIPNKDWTYVNMTKSLIVETAIHNLFKHVYSKREGILDYGDDIIEYDAGLKNNSYNYGYSSGVSTMLDGLAERTHKPKSEIIRIAINKTYERTHKNLDGEPVLPAYAGVNRADKKTRRLKFRYSDMTRNQILWIENYFGIDKDEAISEAIAYFYQNRV